MKESKLQDKPSALTREHPAFQNMKFLYFFYFCGPPGSVSGTSRPKSMRIRMYKKTFCSPLVRKLHLVVTAVREFIQAIDSYKLIPYLSPEDKVSPR
jgi:hypothetical protein